ncbi:MAG: hypothetical protein E5W21_26560 [Mesorhizobium sp.]|nr:MAG: hypothetical protein E5W21_26560 [Mesorhizobium sp.]
MDKAGPTKASPAANIGMTAAENPGKCSHSKRRVIRERPPSAAQRQERHRLHLQKTSNKQIDRWLSDGNQNPPDMKQIDSKTLRFEFA